MCPLRMFIIPSMFHRLNIEVGNGALQFVTYKILVQTPPPKKKKKKKWENNKNNKRAINAFMSNQRGHCVLAFCFQLFHINLDMWVGLRRCYIPSSFAGINLFVFIYIYFV